MRGLFGSGAALPVLGSMMYSCPADGPQPIPRSEKAGSCLAAKSPMQTSAPPDVIAVRVRKVPVSGSISTRLLLEPERVEPKRRPAELKASPVKPSPVVNGLTSDEKGACHGATLPDPASTNISRPGFVGLLDESAIPA
jgi:hypothetical protein